MSLGLPAHLASGAVARGIGRGARVVAAVSLASAFLAQTALAPVEAGAAPFLALLVYAALGVLLWMVDASRSALAAIGYLVGGVLGTAVAAVVASSVTTDDPSVDYPVVLVAVAVTMVGGVTGSHRDGVLLTNGGLLAQAAGLAVAAVITAAPVPFSPVPLLAGLLVIGIHMITATATRSVRRAQPQIHRAARDEALADVRSDVEVRAAALLHDTILGSLTAVASTPPGRIPEKLVHSIERDLAAIVGEDWTEPKPAVTASHLDGPVPRVIEEENGDGLGVDVSGDPALLQRLPDETAHVLALALRQVLINVRRHSGADRAEVVVFGESDSLSVMVIDTGKGFDPDAIPADRFGLRASVFARLETIGGAGRVWSTIGRGTSVLLTVPIPSDVAGSPGARMQEAR